MQHCQRVGALTQAIAHHLFLETEDKERLETAALLHHYDLQLIEGKGGERLLADVLGTAPPPFTGKRIPDGAHAVLDAWRRPGSGTPETRRLAEIVRLADSFDQEYEAAPLEGRSASAILPRLQDGAADGLWSEECLHALEGATAQVTLPALEKWRVPSFPQAAMRILELMRNPHASLRQIEEAAGVDPAIAGRVMQLANSALFGARTSVSTLRDAVNRLGFDTSQRLVVGAAMRPVLVRPKVEWLWPHSIAAADLAWQLADRSGLVDPREAYLCGLIHDVGRIALLSAPLYDSARLHGFCEAGCPPVYAERVLLRTDHGEMSAAIATSWKLPGHMVDAVRWHHRPGSGENRLAAVLYLAEHLTASDEDLPSQFLLDGSLRTLALTPSNLLECTVSPVCEWLAA